MRIAIFGVTGMLGSMVYNVLKDKHDLTLVYRDDGKLRLLDKAYGGVDRHRALQFFPGAADHRIPYFPELPFDTIDAVVNCIGIIKLSSLRDVGTTSFINAIFPHILAKIFKWKLIHITTDSVFDGLDSSPYTEQSEKSPVDLYSLTKSLGEPSDRALVLRTSVIGPEIYNFVSFLEWVKKQKGDTVDGFTKSVWNGITTKQFGKVIDMIVSARSNYPETGLYHIFSTAVTQFEMIDKIAKKYKIGLTINFNDTIVRDRRLATIKDLNDKLNIPTFDEMLSDL